MTSSPSLHAGGLIGIALMSGLLSVPALAQSDDGRYFYGGLGVGQSRAQLNEGRLTDSLLGTGLRATSIFNDKRDTGYKLFGGYQFDRHVGIEAGYVRLGEFGFNAPTQPSGTLGGRIELQSVYLDLVGTLPISDNLSAIGRIGANHARAQGRYTGTGAVLPSSFERSESKTGYKAGLGLQYAFSPSVLLRGEVERYRVPNSAGQRGHVDLYSVSLVFPFGRTPQAAPRAMAAPMSVAAAPMPMAAPAPAPVVMAPPAPAPVAAVAPPARERMSFSAESLFGFDQSTLRAEGREALDAFAKRSEGARFDVVIVEGHTDRLGSTAYNQTLSLQRAEAVKAYLVSAGRFDAMKVSTVGKGETMPVTKPGDCTGTRQTAALIACLKPDRRVEVEMTGTR